MTFEEQQAVIERARRARGEAVSALVRSGARALWNGGLRLRRAWASLRTRSELHALSDRTLRDIGLSRTQIDSMFR
jgi:uncharacterized protein YjiS (DUF1127 family)